MKQRRSAFYYYISKDRSYFFIDSPQHSVFGVCDDSPYDDIIHKAHLKVRDLIKFQITDLQDEAKTNTSYEQL